MFVIIGDRSRAVASSYKNLCLTCQNYMAMKYSLNDREERVCVANYNHPIKLRGPVSQCTDYSDKTRPSKHEMNKIAWAIEPSKRKVGFGAEVDFIPPSKRNDLKEE